MPTAFMDTRYVIALLNRNDEHHQTAGIWANRVRAEGWRLLTTTAIIAEIGDDFRRAWHRISDFLVMLFDDPTIEVIAVPPELAQRAITFRGQRQDKDWGLTDCISFVVMIERGITEALSADHHFQQAGFRALLLEPA